MLKFDENDEPEVSWYASILRDDKTSFSRSNQLDEPEVSSTRLIEFRRPAAASIEKFKARMILMLATVR
jgi:hypothetical protein